MASNVYFTDAQVDYLRHILHLEGVGVRTVSWNAQDGTQIQIENGYRIASMFHNNATDRNHIAALSESSIEGFERN